MHTSHVHLRICANTNRKNKLRAKACTRVVLPPAKTHRVDGANRVATVSRGRDLDEARAGVTRKDAPSRLARLEDLVQHRHLRRALRPGRNHDGLCGGRAARKASTKGGSGTMVAGDARSKQHRQHAGQPCILACTRWCLVCMAARWTAACACHGATHVRDAHEGCQQRCM